MNIVQTVTKIRAEFDRQIALQAVVTAQELSAAAKRSLSEQELIGVLSLTGMAEDYLRARA